MFLGLPTAAVLHDEYWGGCRLLEQGMVWEIVAGTYSGFGVCQDLFLLFSDNHCTFSRSEGLLQDAAPLNVFFFQRC